MHKKHITKDIILHNIKNNDKLFTSEVYVMDTRSYNFSSDLDLKQRELIKSLNDDSDTDSIISLAEVFLAISNDPNWINLNIAKKLLRITILKCDNINVVKKFCYDAIIYHYDKLKNKNY